MTDQKPFSNSNPASILHEAHYAIILDSKWLIELLIVIAIIGILAVSLLPSILDAPKAARDAGKKAKLSGIAVAIERYRSTGSELPGTAGTSVCLNDTMTTDPTFIAISGLSKGEVLGIEQPQLIKIEANTAVAANCHVYNMPLTEVQNAASLDTSFFACIGLANG